MNLGGGFFTQTQDIEQSNKEDQIQEQSLPSLSLQQSRSIKQQYMSIPVSIKMEVRGELEQQDVWPESLVIIGRLVKYHEEQAQITVLINDDTETLLVKIQKHNAQKPQYLKDFIYQHNVYVKMIVNPKIWQEQKQYFCIYMENIKDYNTIIRHELEIILRNQQRLKAIKQEKQNNPNWQRQYEVYSPIPEVNDENSNWQQQQQQQQQSAGFSFANSMFKDNQVNQQQHMQQQYFQNDNKKQAAENNSFIQQIIDQIPTRYTLEKQVYQTMKNIVNLSKEDIIDMKVIYECFSQWEKQTIDTCITDLEIKSLIHGIGEKGKYKIVSMDM